MNRAQKILQAYRNTPWRRQAQMLSRRGAAGVVVASVLLVYIWMTSQAGTYGLHVDEYQRTALAAEQNIQDQRAYLADITSNQALAERAEDLGYIPADPNRVRYMEVEGYYPEPTLQLAPPPSDVHQQVDDDGGLPSDYTVSLIEWLQETIYKLSIRAEGEN